MTDHDDIITLREYLESKLEAIEKANDLQSHVYGERFAGVNEFRAALDDYVKTLVTRQELQATLDKLDLKMDGLEMRIAANQKFIWGLGGAIAVLEIVLRFIG